MNSALAKSDTDVMRVVTASVTESMVSETTGRRNRGDPPSLFAWGSVSEAGQGPSEGGVHMRRGLRITITVGNSQN